MTPTYEKVLKRVKDAIDGILMNHVDTMGLTLNSEALAVEAVRAMQDMMPEVTVTDWSDWVNGEELESSNSTELYEHFKTMGRNDETN